jgi:hypothetical protein
MICFCFFRPVSRVRPTPPLKKRCISGVVAAGVYRADETGNCFLLHETTDNERIAKRRTVNLDLRTVLQHRLKIISLIQFSNYSIFRKQK